MGSRARNSIRAPVRSAKGFPKPCGREPPIEAAKQERADALTHLHEVRSILLVAARVLDERTDPHRLDGAEMCGAEDVAVILRLGIHKVEEAHHALDLGPTGGAP